MNGTSLNVCCPGFSCRQKIRENPASVISLSVGAAFVALAIVFSCLAYVRCSYVSLAASIPFIASGICMILFNKRTK